MCCGTKRLVEIRCPSDCPYLATARDHPPAAILRRNQHDVSFLIEAMRDLNEQQSSLFLVLGTFLTRYRGSELQPVIDEDVAAAARSLAATLETAARGVIYEHRPDSLPAERLAGELKRLLAEAGKDRGAPFDRDAAVVLRRLEQAVESIRPADPASRSPFLELLGRMMRRDDSSIEGRETSPPRLIVP